MGSLSFDSITKSSAALSMAGATDWRTVQTPTVPGFYKAPGPSAIAIAHNSASGTADPFAGFGRSTTWTDGATGSPPQSGSAGSTADGFFIVGFERAWTITAPAGTTAQRLTISCGGYETQLRVTASLSDSSAAAITNSGAALNWTSSFGANDLQLVYQADSAGQTMTVIIENLSPGSGTANLQSVKLQPATIGPATAITLSGPSSGTVGVASSNFTVGANGTITGTVTVTPSDGGDGGTFNPTSVAISSGTPSATFTYTAANPGSPTATINVTNNGGLSNPGGIAYNASASAATSLVVTVPDAAGQGGFSAAVLSTSTPTTGSTVIRTATGLSFNGAGVATIDITGLGIGVGARRWVTLTNSNGDPAQTPAPKQAAGPVTAS